MNINNFIPSTFPLGIPFRGTLSSEDMNNFAEAASQDLSNLATLLNDKIIKVLSTLPDDYSADTSYLDGMFIYVDSTASEAKDGGFFYLKDNETPANSRPLTIYEAFVLFLQILANIDNGLKEGIKVGSYAAKISLTANVPYLLDWPYSDYMFEYKLFSLSGSLVSPASNITVSVDTSTNKISITSTTTQDVWGYLWHPVFNF